MIAPDSGPDANTGATIDATGVFRPSRPGIYRVRATHASGAYDETTVLALSPFTEPDMATSGTADDGIATYAWTRDDGRSTHAEIVGLDEKGGLAALSARAEVSRYADLSVAVLVPADALDGVRPFVRFLDADGGTVALFPLAPHVAPESPPMGGAAFLPSIHITTNVNGGGK